MKSSASCIVISTLFLFSCGASNSDTRREAVSEPSLTQTQTKMEDFGSFFQRFTTDSVFQISRVDFPFHIRTSSEGDESETVIDKAAWRFSPFHYDSSFATRRVDAYTQQVKSYGDTISLELRGVDNGIYIDYEFVFRNGKWFMVSGSDYSN